MKNTIRFLASVLLILTVLLLPVTAADSWMDQKPKLDHVTDNAGLLTNTQQQNLENKAQAIESTYGFGVYIITVEDFRDYDNNDVFEAAVWLYQEYSLGIGDGKDGLLLLLSMAERDYSLITYGDFGNSAFNDEGRACMTKFFLDDFKNNNWYAGFSDYLDWSEDYLQVAKEGEPYSAGNLPMTGAERAKRIAIRIGIILLVPLAIAFIWVGVLTSKMKSVARQTQATAYAAGGLELTQQFDQYIRTTETRTKIEKSSSGGGGGSRSSRSGGFSGTSGKF